YGRDAARYIYWQYEVVSDPQLTEYIEDLGTKLASHSGQSDRRFAFYFIKDKAFNAFATWGGNVAVNTGALLQLEHEGELAALLAHEIGHVVQEAPARQLEFGRQLGWPHLAMLAGALLLIADESELGAAALIGGMAGSYQSFFNFSRGQEREADRIGIKILNDTGYESSYMASLFEQMEQASRFQRTIYSEYLSTHPLTENRIADARNHAAQFASQLSASSLNFELMRVRIQDIHSNGSQNQFEFYRQRITGGTHPKEQANVYGYTLSLMALGRYAEALESIDGLINRAGERIPYLILKSDILKELDELQLAKDALSKAQKKTPNSYAVQFKLAQVHSALEEFEAATEIYQVLIKTRPFDPFVRQQYARTLGKQGETGLAHEQQAELYFILGAFKEAISQLKLAKNEFAGNSRKIALLTKRITELEEELKIRKN
ncbi:MAG TPA: hypothetical protein DCZ03_04530, partial [Gammaproteobacteria bacterium]|nr:hypothetical protein [Gammaproteobacteria bacterium]